MRHTRRAVLGGLLAGATISVAGCRPSGGGDTSTGTGSRPHPLAGLLAGALALVSWYDAAIGGLAGAGTEAPLVARLTALRAEHWTHVTSLARVMGRATPSPTATAAPAVAPDPAGAVAALVSAEQTGAAEAVTLCLAITAQYAALVGSIAASRSTHVEALR